MDINALCGATPLTIAVVKKNEEMAQFLIDNFAIFDGRFFTNIPNPMDVAVKLEMDVVNLMKGYVYEVCNNTYILQNVLLRKKITNESFGKKKYQEQNLNRIEEAVRDTGAALGIALVMEFKNSTSFPDPDEMHKCKRSTGNHTAVLLSKLKQWISDNSEDATFKYYAQMVTLFGPLQQMYHDAIRYGNGIVREASWMIMQPLFAQSNKRNYHTEAMVHIVNFLAMWPLATRELLRKNCSISLNGRVGHNLALDEWVESCIVQPKKKLLNR